MKPNYKPLFDCSLNEILWRSRSFRRVRDRGIEVSNRSEMAPVDAVGVVVPPSKKSLNGLSKQPPNGVVRSCRSWRSA